MRAASLLKLHAWLRRRDAAPKPHAWQRFVDAARSKPLDHYQPVLGRDVALGLGSHDAAAPERRA